MEQKVDEAMVAVGDETGLKKLIGDDFSDADSSDVDDTSTYTISLTCFLKKCLKNLFSKEKVTLIVDILIFELALNFQLKNSSLLWKTMTVMR